MQIKATCQMEYLKNICKKFKANNILTIITTFLRIKWNIIACEPCHQQKGWNAT